jgi:hypothetical protein
MASAITSSSSDGIDRRTGAVGGGSGELISGACATPWKIRGSACGYGAPCAALGGGAPAPKEGPCCAGCAYAGAGAGWTKGGGGDAAMGGPISGMAGSLSPGDVVRDAATFAEIAGALAGGLSVAIRARGDGAGSGVAPASGEGVGAGTEIGRVTASPLFVSTPHAGVRFGRMTSPAGLDGGGGGGRPEARPSKNGSSSAIDPSNRGAAAPRVSVSLRATCFARIAR